MKLCLKTSLINHKLNTAILHTNTTMFFKFQTQGIVDFVIILVATVFIFIQTKHTITSIYQLGMTNIIIVLTKEVIPSIYIK